MNWLKSLRKPVPLRTLAQLELFEARRDLLSCESAAEYADALAAYHRARIERLAAFLSTLPKEPS